MYITRTNQYFICQSSLNPIPWNISDADETFPVDCVYFGKVFKAMEKDLKVKDLTFYLTWDINQLPSYGQNVVAIVLGDEWCRIPKYFQKVKAIFKCYGTRPMLGCNPLLNPSYLNIISFIQFFRNYAASLPRRLQYRLYKFKNIYLGVLKHPYIYEIPLGYYNQIELPVKDIKERLYDVFFAGSLTLEASHKESFLKRVLSAKAVSRQQMISKIYKIQEKDVDLKIELLIQPSFGFQGTRHDAAKVYSEKLMNTKICLVPRGSSPETFRFFEALRYGCIIISEKLPSHWFYNGAPYIELSKWDELENILIKLKDDENLMQKMHEQSLDWWKTKCSEDAVGGYMAEKLNSI
ncbi:glycosyltransferase family 1 protein [Pelatocladus sp. BLCC-F211]|uniref:glycosyltransferase family 1 protein n=1 Tax=Pelatocladus sp. BLCC-F211 TaxID=3342752 RepID=UPI0035B9DA0E